MSAGSEELMPSQPGLENVLLSISGGLLEGNVPVLVSAEALGAARVWSRGSRR